MAAGAEDSGGRRRKGPERAASDPSRDPSGFEETIKTPPPEQGEDTMPTVPAVSDHDPLAKTIKTPPPDQADMTQVTSAGFQSDQTMATQGPDQASGRGGGGDPAPGEVWGDFEIGPLLGRGGMGAVYRARQISLDRPVALKVLPQHLSQNHDFRKRFVLEARSVARISCPHIIQVIAAGEYQGNLYFAMEYVEGKDLSARLKAGMRPDPTEALDLVLQAAEGLAEAGDHHLVHRDIKPSNMMVTDDGRLKIMDFGLVKQAKGSEGLTMAGTVMGTVSYFSPEQGRGGPIDHRTDIYALGVVFYELLCGKLPFTGDDPSAVIYQHLHTEPKPPREINPSVPEGYQAVVLKCMQKRPEDRYATAKDLIADLQSVRRGGEPKTALLDPKQLKTGATVSTSTDFSSDKRGRSRGLLVALLVVAALGGGGWWAYDRYGEELRPYLGLAPDGADASPDDAVDPDRPPPPARSGDLERARDLLGDGDLDAVEVLLASQRAAGDLDEEWRAVARRVAAARADALVERARSELAAGDGVAAAQVVERLADLDPDHAALDQLRVHLAAQAAAREALAEARQALGEGRTERAMTALAKISTDGLADAQREAVAELTADARAVGTMLEKATKALAADDLQTARQVFGAAYQQHQNVTASLGLEAVTLCKRFNDAVADGDLAAATQAVDELTEMDRFPDLVASRQTRLQVARALSAADRALASQDFEAAEAALKRLRELDASSRAIAHLEHRVELERRVLAFNRALDEADLDAATAALAAIKQHDGERDAWRAASQRLEQSRLAERAEAERIAAQADEVRRLVDAERPDFAAVDRALRALVELAGADHAEVHALERRIAERRAELEIAATLADLDRAVLAGERETIAALVADTDHAAAMERLVGQEDLELAHSVDALALDDGDAVAEVSVRAAMKVAPETIIRYRYRLSRGEQGWRVTAVERLPQP